MMQATPIVWLTEALHLLLYSQNLVQSLVTQTTHGEITKVKGCASVCACVCLVRWDM